MLQVLQRVSAWMCGKGGEHWRNGGPESRNSWCAVTRWHSALDAITLPWQPAVHPLFLTAVPMVPGPGSAPGLALAGWIALQGRRSRVWRRYCRGCHVVFSISDPPGLSWSLKAESIYCLWDVFIQGSNLFIDISSKQRIQICWN